MTADVDAAPVSEDDDWTPIAKTVARLKRSQSEVPGSMQHFAVVLHLGEVVTKLHALVLLGILERFEGGAISPLSFELARASSAGTWIGALREVVGRVQPKMLADEDGKAWFAELRAWLSRPRGRPDAEVLDAVLQPLAELAALLNPGAGSGRGELRTPLDLMQSFVEVRNKTTGTTLMEPSSGRRTSEPSRTRPYGCARRALFGKHHSCSRSRETGRSSPGCSVGLSPPRRSRRWA